MRFLSFCRNIKGGLKLGQIDERKCMSQKNTCCSHVSPSLFKMSLCTSNCIRPFYLSYVQASASLRRIVNCQGHNSNVILNDCVCVRMRAFLGAGFSVYIA